MSDQADYRGHVLRQLAAIIADGGDIDRVQRHLERHGYDCDDPITNEGTAPDGVAGEVIATRTLPTQETDFRRAALNSLEFRGLDGGTYKLVKVSDDNAPEQEAEHAEETHESTES